VHTSKTSVVGSKAEVIGVKADTPDTGIEDELSRAEQGDADAQYKLGNNYYFGLGVNQDLAEARRWYLKAAENGHSEAQYSVGYNFENGLFVDTNIDEARIWYRKSAAQGYALAVSALDRIESAEAVIVEPLQAEDIEVEAHDLSERLKKVKQLLDDGLITESEAAMKRQTLLDEL
jgi:hypothetical protein